LFGYPEAQFLARMIENAAVDENGRVRSNEDARMELRENVSKNLESLRKGNSNLGSNFDALLASGTWFAGIEGALFGRFVTSDILARTDASVHVAHAFTVHALDNEVDYFTVVDDLKEAGEDAGAAHAGDMELGAGLFYGYVVVDVPLLISNLSGCDRREWRDQPEAIDDARDVLTGLVNSIATVSPGAKLGATAPYARTDCALLETGDMQPRSLANAYLDRLRPNGDVMQQAVNTLGGYLGQLDGMYGVEGSRFISSTRDTGTVPEARRAPLNQTIEAALNSIFGGA
jgi:CRISPR system Cascade subunit CasC